jgi:hypothetical protein
MRPYQTTKLPGVLNARVALCTASRDEQARSDGVAMAQDAARSNCRLEAILDALMRYSDM